MELTMWDVRHGERDEQHTLGLDKQTRDALATYCRLRWPHHTAKQAAREWDLSLDEGRGIVAGRASQTTIDKVWKHTNGGWSVLIPVLGAVIGQPVEDFFASEKTRIRHARREHEARLSRVGEAVRNLRSRSGVASDGVLPRHRSRSGMGD